MMQTQTATIIDTAEISVRQLLEQGGEIVDAIPDSHWPAERQALADALGRPDEWTELEDDLLVAYERAWVKTLADLGSRITLLTMDGVSSCSVSPDNLLVDPDDPTRGRCVDEWSRDHRVHKVDERTWQCVTTPDPTEDPHNGN
jgi:hypothetical protein